MTTGNLGLTDKEEDQIVAFLQTLTDGFTRPYPNRDTFTGSCMTGGSAKTQGNEFLIPTPPLPPAHRLSAVFRLSPIRLFRSTTLNDDARTEWDEMDAWGRMASMHFFLPKGNQK